MHDVTSVPASPRRRWLLIAGAYTAMCLIWGSTWSVIKVGLSGAPPGTALGLRFLIAAFLVAFILSVRRIPLPRGRHFWTLSLFLGAFHMAAPYSLVYWSEQHIASGLTAVLYATMPLVVAVLARIGLGAPLTPAKLAGILVGIAGVAVIFSDSLQIPGVQQAQGVGAVLLSVCFASLSTVVVKKHGGSYQPLAALLIPFAIAGLLVLAVAVPVERSNPLHYSATTWSTILYLAAAGSTIAFAFLFWVIQQIDVTVVSYQTFIIPVLAVILGWLLLDETVSGRLLAGAALILAGIALATLVGRTATTNHDA